MIYIRKDDKNELTKDKDLMYLMDHSVMREKIRTCWQG